MIRYLRGDHIEITADEQQIIMTVGGQRLILRDQEWRELVYLLRIVGEANSDRPA